MKKADLELKVYSLENKNRSLERQVDYLLSELIDLNQGLGVRPPFFISESTWDLAMKHKAGLAIKKLYEMRK